MACSLVTDLIFRSEILPLCLVLQKAASRSLRLVCHRMVHAAFIIFQCVEYRADISDRQLRRCGRGRGAQICHEIDDRCVGLMADGGDHRRMAGKNGTRYFFLIERPKILDRTASAAHDQHIQIQYVQTAYALHDAVRRSLSLHQGRVEDDLDKGIPAECNVFDILHSSSRRCCDNADFLYIRRNRLLVLRGKHAHLFQFCF